VKDKYVIKVDTVYKLG